MSRLLTIRKTGPEQSKSWDKEVKARGDVDILSVLELVLGDAAGAGDIGSGEKSILARNQFVLANVLAQHLARQGRQTQPPSPLG